MKKDGWCVLVRYVVEAHLGYQQMIGPVSKGRNIRHLAALQSTANSFLHDLGRFFAHGLDVF